MSDDNLALGFFSVLSNIRKDIYAPGNEFDKISHSKKKGAAFGPPKDPILIEGEMEEFTPTLGPDALTKETDENCVFQML